MGRQLVGEAWPTARGAFPWGTFLINVSGSLLIGILMRSCTSYPRNTGFCGALTTYSTFNFETWRLIEEEAYRAAVANVVVRVVVALAAVVVGYAASAALTG